MALSGKDLQNNGALMRGLRAQINHLGVAAN
jgi:hypothetical protein